MPIIVAGAMAGTIRGWEAIGGSSTGEEDSPSAAQVILRYDADGGVRHTQTSTGGTSTTDLGEWSKNHPNETDGANWSLKIVFVSGDNNYSAGSGLGTVQGAGGTGWVTLGGARSWTFTYLTASDPQLGNYTIYLSYDGGTTVYDSVAYVVNLQVFP